MRRWIVTALGKDQPGIVAGVTQVLFKLGCNLEDSAMTRLEGEFTIMLIFSSPASKDEQAIRRAFEALSHRFKLVVHLKPLSATESKAPRSRGKAYLISIYGGDRPGIVYQVSNSLAKSRINITDVHTHRSSGRGPHLYLLLLEVEIPKNRSVKVFEAKLKRLAKKLGVEVSLRPAEVEVL